MRRLLFAIFLVIPLFAQPPRQPVYRTGIKLGEIGLHDPWILAHQDSKTYYLYTAGRVSQNGQNRAGVVTYKSKDLETWEGPQTVFAVPDGLWANPAHGAWAPEVHQYRGKFYLFVTLHNNDKLIDQPEDRPIYNGELANRHMRGTQIFVGASPEGPFQPLENRPAPPEDFMTLDGTLFVEGDVPYMVYAHEWIQMLDGTMEAVALKPDLSAAVGEPFFLFKASDAPWLQDQQKITKKSRKLLMIWSSYRDELYVESIAHSITGKLRGPWQQDDVLVGDDSGHGMLFKSFDGRLMLILHQPFRNARGKLFEIEDTGDTLRIKRQLVY
jgi:hypothetical protein